MPVSSSTKANETRQAGLTAFLLAKFPLNDPYTTGLIIIVRQGGILHTMKMSSSRYRGSVATL